MMSNCNSPLLDRASPFRVDSVDRGDGYRITKDLVIGELTSRMRQRCRKPYDKNRRGENGHRGCGSVPNIHSGCGQM